MTTTETKDPGNIPDELEELAWIIKRHYQRLLEDDHHRVRDDWNNDEFVRKHITYDTVPHRKYGSQHGEYWVIILRKLNESEWALAPEPSSATVQKKKNWRHDKHVIYALYD